MLLPTSAVTTPTVALPAIVFTFAIDDVPVIVTADVPPSTTNVAAVSIAAITSAAVPDIALAFVNVTVPVVFPPTPDKWDASNAAPAAASEIVITTSPSSNTILFKLVYCGSLLPFNCVRFANVSLTPPENITVPVVKSAIVAPCAAVTASVTVNFISPSLAAIAVISAKAVVPALYPATLSLIAGVPVNAIVPDVASATILELATVIVSVIVIVTSSSLFSIAVNFVESILSLASDIPPVNVTVPVVLPTKVFASLIVNVPDACTIVTSASLFTIVSIFANVVPPDFNWAVVSEIPAVNETLPLVFAITANAFTTVIASVIVIPKSASSDWIFPNFVASIFATSSEIPPVYVTVPVVFPANVLPSSIVIVPDACVILISFVFATIVFMFVNCATFELSLCNIFADVSDIPSVTVNEPVPITANNAFAWAIFIVAPVFIVKLILSHPASSVITLKSECIASPFNKFATVSVTADIVTVPVVDSATVLPASTDTASETVIATSESPTLTAFKFV